MTGGLLQLVAKGKDDLYIIEDPQITFFKIVYRRHTNFCMYPCYLNFDNELDFGQSANCILKTKGDLITQLNLEIVLPDILMEIEKVNKKQIKNILKEYDIIWNYTGLDNEIVTINIYKDEIIPLIESKINELNIKYNSFQIDLKYLESLKQYFYISTDYNHKYDKNEYKIHDDFDLIHALIKNKIKSTKYYDILLYLLDTIETIHKENENNKVPLKLLNMDDLINIVYNNLLKSQTIGSIGKEYSILGDLYDNNDIILYNIIDNTKFYYTSNSISELVVNNLQYSYDKVNVDSNIMSVVILQKYLMYLEKNNIKVNNSFNILEYKTNILNNIEWNIKKTIYIIINLIQIIVDTYYGSPKAFQISIYKTFKLSSNKYIPFLQFNIVQNNDVGLQNNFLDLIKLQKMQGEPENIYHFFGEYVVKEYNKFENSLMNNYLNIIDKKYFDNIILWDKFKLNGDTQILTMSIIPLVLVDDIPDYIYNKIKQFDILIDFDAYFIGMEINDFRDTLKIEINNNLIPITNDYINSLKNKIEINDKILLSIFTSEQFYTINNDNSYNYNLLVELEEKYNKNTVNSYQQLLSIEYIIFKYILYYFDLINTIPIADENKEESKNYIYEVLKVFRYIDFYDNLPSYDNYAFNGYTLSIINNIGEILNTSPKYIDATCSIYYVILKNNIKIYNNFFNNLLSYNVINKEIGIQMAKIILLFNNNKLINYYYNENNIQNNGSDIIEIYLNVYFIVFVYDMSTYFDKKILLEIKNIEFKDKYKYYYIFTVNILDYIVETLKEYNPKFSKFEIPIYDLIHINKNYETVFDYVLLLLFRYLFNKYGIFDMEYNDTFYLLLSELFFNDEKLEILFLYNELQKLGIFNMFKYKKDVINYIIYHIAKNCDLLYYYDFIGYYTDLNFPVINDLSYYISKIKDYQIDNLLDKNYYNTYYNIVIRIIHDYDLYIDYTINYYSSFNKIVDNFTDVEFNKYNITEDDIIILKIIISSEYIEISSILRNKNKIKNIKNDVEIFENIKSLNVDRNYNSLIFTYDSLKQYYNENINKIKLILDKISINVKNKKNIDIKVFRGSELDNKLSLLIDYNNFNFRWAKEIGHYIIDKISIKIGGQMIEEHDYEWYRLQNLIFIDKNKEKGYNKMIGNVPELYLFNNNINYINYNDNIKYYKNNVKNSYLLTIPLNFWFSKYYQLALPLVALQYTDVIISVKLKNLEDIAMWNPNAKFIKKPKLKCQILSNYIYIEEEERKKLCESKHEILIEMVQKNGDIIIGKNDINNNNIIIETNFNNSSKFIIGYVKFINKNQTKQDIFNWTDDTIFKIEKIIDINNNIRFDTKKINPIKNIIIKFNGKTRETKKNFDYYNLVQSYKTNTGTLSDNMFLYSFALNISNLQPSGTCNMSRLNDLSLIIELDDYIIEEINNNNLIGKIHIYNYSYNLLRIMSGLGGLAFYN